METYTAEKEKPEIIGTKLAEELGPGDKVYFPGAGLVKQVHGTYHHRDGRVMRDSTDTDPGLWYGPGVTVRWAAPHNKLSWHTSFGTQVRVVA